jgi:hypothetical protein
MGPTCENTAIVQPTRLIAAIERVDEGSVLCSRFVKYNPTWFTKKETSLNIYYLLDHGSLLCCCHWPECHATPATPHSFSFTRDRSLSGTSFGGLGRLGLPKRLTNRIASAHSRLHMLIHEVLDLSWPSIPIDFAVKNRRRISNDGKGLRSQNPELYRSRVLLTCDTLGRIDT